MSGRSRRRLAASILKVGEKRIWLDPDDMDARGDGENSRGTDA